MADKPKEPPVTAPIPGARPLSPEEQEELGDKLPKRPSILDSLPIQKSRTRLGSIHASAEAMADAIRQVYTGRIAGGEQEARAWQERTKRSSESAMVPEGPSKPNFWTYADKAMFGLCEFLALLFGLPFGEDLYHDKPIANIGGWHWFYFGIAVLFAVTGPMWPWLRTRTWLPAGVAASLSRAPLDARLWIATLLLLFLYGTAPEIYQRATAPAAPPSVIHATPEDIAKAIAPIQAEREQAIKERDAARAELAAAQTGGRTQFAVGDEVATLSIYYQVSSATISAASANIKEAIIQPVIQNFGQGLGQLNYSIPIKITFYGEFGPFNVSLMEPISSLFGTTSSMHISITKNEKAELDILIGSAPSVIQMNGVFSISIRKQ